MEYLNSIEENLKSFEDIFKYYRSIIYLKIFELTEDIFNSFQDRYLLPFEDIFNLFEDIFKSFEDIFNSFEVTFKSFVDIFDSFEDIFKS